MTARGIRNNNPGNIRYVENVTSTYWGCTGSDGAFCTFDTPTNGIRALASLLHTYQTLHGLNTIAGIVHRWAPASDSNDEAAYRAAMSRSSGFAEDAQLNLGDFATLSALTVAIVEHENGAQPYSNLVITDGVDLALRGAGENAFPPPADALDAALSGATVEPASTPTPAPPSVPMPILPLIAAFGPVLAQLIPQLVPLFPQKTEVAQRNVAAAKAVFDTVVQSSGQPNLQAAVEAMQASPDLTKVVAAQVLTQPDIVDAIVVEIGKGGIAAARDFSLAAQNAPESFLRNPAFWVTLLLLAMVFMLLADIFYVHPTLWDAGDKKQVITAVLMIITLVAGFWLGSSIGSHRKTELAAGNANS